MADFIAVIRRAVDGLSDNTPEMRAKVYERARSAVVRQLENMKPRPPEAMFQKQLDKLDAAIREVETEHTEALPAETVPAAEDVAPFAATEETPAYEEPADAYPAAETAPAQEETAVAPVYHDAVEAHQETHVEAAPAVIHQEPARQESIDDFLEPAPTHPDEPVQEVNQPAAASREDVYEQPGYEAEPEPFSHTAVAERDDAIAAAPVIEDDRDHEVVAANPVHHAFDDAPAAELPVEEVRDWAVEIDQEPETVLDPADESAALMPKVSYDETDVASDFNEFVQQEINRTVVPPPPKKAAREEFSWDAPFDDLPEIPKPAAFEEALEAKQKEIASQQAAARENAAKIQPSAREELEELIGFEREPVAAKASTATASDLPTDVARAVNKLEGKTFRHQRKKKKSRFSPVAISLGLAGALVLAGGAFALWHYKDNVSQLVASLMPKSDTTQPADQAKTEVKPVEKAADKQAAEKPADATKNTEVASLETDAGPQKFTQRLMPDGSESDSNAAKVPVDQALEEGKSVAGQTEKGKDVAATETNPATDTNAGKPAAETPALGATQKMFLYEERLGQTSPVAVPGTIVWSEKTDSADGKPAPEIQAQIDIPERKITALVTFKRNTDPSLPASHIVEIVFDIPKDFPEGNVESIQRIAFKQTEQDRGDALVAVPAKITDDFHMVALNDDADARKANLELMKRAWIDIPITYRNGRRALITLEKGATGTAVFDKVLSEWSALSNQTAN